MAAQGGGRGTSTAIRVAALVVGLLAIAGALAAKGCSGGGGGSTSAASSSAPPATTATPGLTAAPPADAVTVSIAFSPEKATLMKQAIADFNATATKANGHQVVVQGEQVSSGAAFDRLRANDLQPVIWSPASSLWGRLLTQVADVSWVPDRSPSLARSPLVIAMWEPEARALGWPTKALGWADIAAAAQDPKGWAAYGHPEWGRFRLGQTSPDFSTSGLSAVAAQYLFATGKDEGLTVADVEADPVREKVRAIQSSIVHYGDTTVFFADQLAAHGRAYASAVAMEETTVVDFNARKRNRDRLVAIYPKEGTFFSDNPLIVLDAPWVTADQKAGAQAFVDYLESPAIQGQVSRYGLRPGDSTVKPGGDISAANGVDPAQPTKVLALPDPKVLARIRELWHEDRKPADVSLVLDVSGSMNDQDKLAQAQEGLVTFLDQLSPRDRVSLVVFADEPQLAAPLRALSPDVKQGLVSTIQGLIADGGTSVYDATLASVQELGKTGDPTHIRAAVVLTDGVDNRSTSSLDDVVAAGRKQGGEGDATRVFTIAYGQDADVDGLKAIATAFGGKSYVGDPNSIKSVYTQISSFF